MQATLSDSIPAVTIDALLELIVVIDQRGTILAANKAWRDFALANGGDPLCLSEGINYLDVCDRAALSGCGDAAYVAQLVRDILAGRTRSATFDYRCDAPHEARWFSLKISALDHAGAPAAVLLHDNITELKSCERQIQFQASLLASVEQAIIATDIAGTILYWNPFAEKLYGWSAAEAMGRNIIDLVPADTSAERAAQIMARLQAGCSWSGEFWVRHRDGRTFPMHVTDSPIRDDQGRLIGVIGISTDISEWKKTERALSLSAMVYEAIGEAIMITAPDERIVAVNPAFTRLAGYAEHELIGQSARMLLAGTLGREHNGELLQRLERSGHAQGKVWTRHKNGEECAEWLRIDSIFDEGGQVKFRVNMFSGITDQKLAEETIWRQANVDFLTGLPNRTRTTPPTSTPCSRMPIRPCTRPSAAGATSSATSCHRCSVPRITRCAP